MMGRYMFGIAALLSSVSASAVRAEVASDGPEAETIIVTGNRAVNTGTKTDTPLIETPQSISIVTQEQLSIRNVQGVEEALRYTSGVVVDQQGYDPRYEQTSIRGFASTSFGDFRDGMKQVTSNGSYYRTEVYGLQAIEIFKGPSSVLYGQNAPGGLVNFITKRPTDSFFAEAQIDYGSFDRFVGRADIGGAATDNLSLRFTALARSSKTQIQDAPDDRIYVAPAATIRIGENTDITILGHYLYDNTMATPWYVTVDGQPTDVPIRDPSWDFFHQNQYQIGYLAEHRFSDKLRFRQNLRYGRIDLLEKYQFIAATDTESQVVIRGRGKLDETSDGFTLDNQLMFELGTGKLEHKILIGADYSSSRYDWQADLVIVDNILPYTNPDYNRSYEDPPLYATSSQTQKQLGVYLQDQIKLDALTATIGLRYDDAKSDTITLIYPGAYPLDPPETRDKATTWRAALSYKFDIGLLPYLSYSTSFQLTPGIDYFGNAFQPSRGKQFELGAKYELRAFPGFVTLAWFDLRQTNVLTTDADHIGFQIQTGAVKTHGLELEANLKPADRLNLILAYTYLDTKIESNDATNGKELLLQPRHTLSAFADYSLPFGLGFGGGLRYLGDSWADELNSIRNDSRLFVDAQLHYSWGKWRIGVNATNLFDKTSYNCSYGACARLPQRTVLASVKVRL
ncbi:TonB-dependent siderophore receptor [Sandaracinobacter neustonicus]|nr:TonB-dependent siderophore receptor [Sandaracinobacter neustonicus]